MTRSQREALVEHYLAGDMSAAEEQEFFMTVAVDGELLGTLRAHRQVERALRRDREALPSGYAAVQERALAMLAVQPQVSSMANPRKWFSGSRFSGWITMASTALVFAVAGYAGRDMISQPSRDAVQPVQSVSTTSQQIQRPQSDIPTTIFAIPNRDSAGESATPAMQRSQGAATETVKSPATTTAAERPLRASDATAREAVAENNRKGRADTSVVRDRRQPKPAAVAPPVTTTTQEAETSTIPKSEGVGFTIGLKKPKLKNPKK
jgi:hypothetical protein